MSEGRQEGGKRKGVCSGLTEMDLGVQGSNQLVHLLWSPSQKPLGSVAKCCI